MLKFFEVNSDVLFVRKFTLTDDGVVIGGGTLKYVNRVVEIHDFRIDKPEYADLLAGSLLNAAALTEVGRVRVPKGDHWGRFGLEDKGDCLEQDTDKLVWDSVCKGHHDTACSHDCGSCADKNTCNKK